MRHLESETSRRRREIERQQSNLVDISKKEATLSDRIFRSQQALAKTSSESTARSRRQEIERCQREVLQLKKKRSDAHKKIADETKLLHRAESRLTAAQQQEYQKTIDEIQQQQMSILQNRASQFEERFLPERSLRLRTEAPKNPNQAQDHFDVFISHASEDKDDIVRPLAEKLHEKGYNVWYDDFQLKVGDSLRRSIDKGLSKARFGIVILSPSFFAKNWTQYELDGLVQREQSEQAKIILPIWHHISRDEVLSYSPTLADKIALNTSVASLEQIVDSLVDALEV